VLRGFLLFPLTHFFEDALGVVKFLDVAVPLFRRILGLLLPLLPVAIRELLRWPEAVQLGRLLEGQIVGFLRLAIGQAFFKVFKLRIVAPLLDKELLTFFEFLAEFEGGGVQAFRPIELPVLQHLELSEDLDEGQLRYFYFVVFGHKAYYPAIAGRF
jgi:hypothetical protein